MRLFRDHQTVSMQSAPRRVESARFSSQCLGEFLKRLKRVDPHPAVLDLGVLCGDNIAYLGKQGCRVSVESHPLPGRIGPKAVGVAENDRRTVRSSVPRPAHVPSADVPPADVPMTPLNYPPESFSGVLAWDAISQIPFQEGIGFVETLRQLLLDGGVVLAYFPGPPDSPRGSSGRYRIMAGNKLSVEVQGRTARAGHVYQNREIYSVFSRFDIVRLSHLKSGTREVLVVKSRRVRRPRGLRLKLG